MRVFSLLSILIVVGFIVWFSVQSLNRTQSSQTVEDGDSTNSEESRGGILAPIEEAKNTKDQIESRSRESVQGGGG